MGGFVGCNHRKWCIWDFITFMAMPWNCSQRYVFLSLPMVQPYLARDVLLIFIGSSICQCQSFLNNVPPYTYSTRHSRTTRYNHQVHQVQLNIDIRMLSLTGLALFRFLLSKMPAVVTLLHPWEDKTSWVKVRQATPSHFVLSLAPVVTR